MFRYKKGNQLVTSAIPLQGLTLVTLSDEDVKYFVGFDTMGKPIIDKNKFAEIEKQKRVNEINAEFDRQCSKVGIDFEGNKFQYDDTSRSRLAETKDDARVTFWRSVDNKNILLSNVKKNSLYKVLIDTYYTEFAKKSQVIDGL
jgi:methionyl-tRNA synthetase